jgi:hypothetical protein
MRLRAVVAFATLIGGLGLAGWAAAGIGSWNVSSSDANDDASPPPAVASTAPAVSVHARIPPAQPASAAHLVDLSLLNPRPMHVEPELRRTLTAAYQAPRENVEPVPAAAPPMPAPQARKLIDTREAGGLTVAQVARIKANLRLTPDQEEYWRPVEQALLEIARDMASQKAGGRNRIAISAEVSQRLYWTAGPLIMSLRDDQRREARNLARSMGLEKVASLI